LTFDSERRVSSGLVLIQISYRKAISRPDRIISAYANEKLYSVELIGAVLRQETFVRKMYDLKWTFPGFFDTSNDERALQHALARYHAYSACFLLGFYYTQHSSFIYSFLDLMSSSPVSFFVPTLDIDLVWHTHQLMPNKYKSDCEQYLNRFVDQFVSYFHIPVFALISTSCFFSDDKIEGLHLSSAFDLTCRAWKSRFNINYTHCGCPIPGDGIGKKLERLIGLQKPAPSQLVPYNRPDLLSATHPSDHNAVRYTPSTESVHKQMMRRYDEVLKEKERKAKKAAEKAARRDLEGKGIGLDQPHNYYQSRTTTTTRGIDASEERPYYYGAFIVPVPIGFVSAESCVAGYPGSSIHPPGSCGGGCSGGGCKSTLINFCVMALM